MPASTTLILPTEADTAAVGAALAPQLTGGMLVFLSGELGSGKTTLVRALLRRLGERGPVKSPTYTLVEPYVLSRLYFYHFDFYRIKEERAVDEIGFREYLTQDAVCLVEWPERAGDRLPRPDLRLTLRYSGSGRRLEMCPETEVGKLCLERMDGELPAALSRGSSRASL